MKIKSRQLLKILLIVLPILFLCVLILRVIVSDAEIVYPSPETQSAFLRSYTLAEAIAPLSPLRSQLSGPDSAGRGCAFHQRESQSWLLIASGNSPALMAAVRQDLESRLSRDGSQIVAEKGNASERFQYDYAVGKTKGSVIVDPLVIADAASVAGQAGLRPGQLAVKLHVQISETWYKASEMGCRKL
jgi:hypothetical protein